MKPIMKKLLSACSFIALTSSAAFANDQTSYRASNDWYTSVTGDITWMDSNTGGGGDIAIGKKFLPSDFGNFRIEGEVGYHDFSDSHYFTYMGNLYYDFDSFPSPSSLKIVPYIGGGIGDATIHLGESDIGGRYSDSGDVFAYQFMAGLTFVSDAAPNTEWSIGYRYLGSDSNSTTDNLGFNTSDRLRADNLELAVRVNF